METGMWVGKMFKWLAKPTQTQQLITLDGSGVFDTFCLVFIGYYCKFLTKLCVIAWVYFITQHGWRRRMKDYITFHVFVSKCWASQIGQRNARRSGNNQQHLALPASAAPERLWRVQVRGGQWHQPAQSGRAHSHTRWVARPERSRLFLP